MKMRGMVVYLKEDQRAFLRRVGGDGGMARLIRQLIDLAREEEAERLEETYQDRDEAIVELAA